MRGRRASRTSSIAAGAALVALWCSAPTGYAQAAGAQPLFDSHDILAVTLSGPLNDIAASRKKDDQPYLPATLSYVAADGTAVALDLEMRARGNFRRRTCRFPPLRLRFDKASTAATVFHGQRRLKLVGPCKPSAKFEQFVVEEYLVYRAYALLSEHAFRVRPLQVRFVDSAGRARERSSFAFLIEDEKRMAKRYGLDVVTDETVSYAELDPDALAVFGLFQYLIGGHDWSVVAGPPGTRCCHNARVLRRAGDSGTAIPVPYDFDFAGIINPPYASPPDTLPINSVRQRLYRGRCADDAVWAAAAERFRARRAQIEALYRNFEPLSARRLKQSLAYLGDFYAVLDDPQERQRKLLDKCVG